MKRFKKEDGMLIVEATMVFPVMFLVIFTMLYLGNAYFQKSRVEAVVNDMAFYGAAQCADPLLKIVEDNNGVPSYSEANYEIQPYRYLMGEWGSSGGMNQIEDDIEKQIKDKIGEISTGLFAKMKPRKATVDAEFQNAFIYTTLDVEVSYEVPLPIRLIGMEENFCYKSSIKIELPVSDTPEFIRNVNMVEDWIESTEAGQKAIDKTKNIMTKVAEYIN